MRFGINVVKTDETTTARFDKIMARKIVRAIKPFLEGVLRPLCSHREIIKAGFMCSRRPNICIS